VPKWARQIRARSTPPRHVPNWARQGRARSIEPKKSSSYQNYVQRNYYRCRRRTDSCNNRYDDTSCNNQNFCKLHAKLTQTSH
jgi:hypothetical protein